MRRAAAAALATACALLVLVLLPDGAVAGGMAVEVSTKDLLADWEEYDGREVIFRGEAVGDVMRRGEGAWVTVNDDIYSREPRLETGELRGRNSGIGIWLPLSEAEKIEMLGRYGTMGDLVEVRGTFNADCREHGGDFDIHAHTLTVIEPGREFDTGPDKGRLLALLFVVPFLIITLVPFLRHRAREMREARALLRKEEEGPAGTGGGSGT